MVAQTYDVLLEANIDDWKSMLIGVELILTGNVTVHLHDIEAFHSLRFWMYYIISTIRLQLSGQQERAAAVALFNNKIREAIKILSSDRLRDNSMGGTGNKDAFNPISSNIHIQILQTDLHIIISLKNELREFDKRSTFSLRWSFYLIS